MSEQKRLVDSADADKQFVGDLEVGQRVESPFLLDRCDVRTRQSGEAYLVLEFSDRSGRIPGRMWERASEAAREVQRGETVWVEGTVDTWQSSPQLKVDILRAADPARFDPADFLPASERDPAEMFDELVGKIASMENDHLRALLQRLFDDDETARRVRRAPGGMKLHHAYVGGLLEHTLSVVGLAERVAEHYPHLDRDLLLAGAILHDLGKIWELSYDGAFDYTESGRLVGHLLLEVEAVAGAIDDDPDFPPALEDHLLHLLASHHGSHEHGAPVLPATPEALALHYLDDLDSKMAAMGDAIDEATDLGADAVYSPSLGRRVLRRRWDDAGDDR